MSVAQQRQENPYGEIELAGQALVADWAGCLYWPAEACLIVSDLHLEKGSSHAVRGRFMPPYDTGVTLTNLAQRLAVWAPKRVICLGDSFHDDQAVDRLPTRYRAQLRSAMAGRDWVWIAGNHDPGAPAGLAGAAALELACGPLVFRHEPSAGTVSGEIAGHLHPAGKINRRGRSVRRRCFAGDGERLIMPSFGAFTGGLNVRDEAFDGLFEPERLCAWMLGDHRVYRIGGNDLVR